MLRIIGGWGSRQDSLESAVDRLQRSVSCIPDESGKRGQWGYWQRRHPDHEHSELDFVPIDVGDAGALADVIVRVGFIDRPRPHNHIAFDVDDDTDERILAGYLGALIEAWQPDRLGVLNVEPNGPRATRGRRSQSAA